MTQRARARQLVGRRLSDRARRGVVESIDVGCVRVAIPANMTEAEAFEHAAKFARGLAFRLAGLGATLILLTACASSPTVATLPSICPATPTTPAEARAEFPEFLPVLNESEMQAGDTRRAAGELLRVRVDSAAQYQTLRANRDALRDWILSHSKE